MNHISKPTQSSSNTPSPASLKEAVQATGLAQDADLDNIPSPDFQRAGKALVLLLLVVCAGLAVFIYAFSTVAPLNLPLSKIPGKWQILLGGISVLCLVVGFLIGGGLFTIQDSSIDLGPVKKKTYT